MPRTAAQKEARRSEENRAKRRATRNDNKELKSAAAKRSYERNKEYIKERVRARYCTTDPRQWAKLRCSSIKTRANRDGVPFNLTPDDLLAALPDDMICPAIGIPMVLHSKGAPSANTASVDKLIPSLGYIPGNIEVISQKANTLKQDVTDPEWFRKLADYVKSRCLKNKE